MSNLQQLKVTFDAFDDLMEIIGPGLSRTHLFTPTPEEIPAGTRVRLEIGTVRKGALIRGVAKVAGPGDDAAQPGLHLHIIHLDPSSTRLVDSLVRGEIAGAGESSGPSPFDIPPAETAPVPEPEPEPEPEAEVEPGLEPKAASTSPAAAVDLPPEAPEPAARGRLGRYAWPLVLAGLAGAFLLVFQLASRYGENPLLTGRDRQTVAGEPESAEPEAGSGEPAVAEPPLASEPPVAAGALPASAADPEADAEQVEQVVLAWADAWSRQDPGAYLELYAPDYSPPGLERGDWQGQRRARITAPESLEITVSELEAEILDSRRAIVRFHQLYVTGDKRLAARKVLELERLTAGWKIVGERVEQGS